MAALPGRPFLLMRYDLTKEGIFCPSRWPYPFRASNVFHS